MQMTRAERVALETFPPDVIKTIHGEFDNNAYARALFWKGYDQCLKDFLGILQKWEDHAIRGMKIGSAAYHQGKVALITDLKDWMNETGGGKNL